MRQTYRFLFATLMLVVACRPAAPPPVQQDEPSRFLNTAEDVAYVGDAACAQCHGELVKSYQTHGMAQSYYPLTAANAVEQWPGPVVYHAPTNLYYRAYREGEAFYQEEYRLDEAGRRTHHLVREMQYVMGSGSAARTYITVENGWHYQLPLTWYTQQRRWDLSPGYRAANARFDRIVPDRCMACHNAYPDAVPFTDGKYTSVPLGISCERCHGPGALHVDAQLSGMEAEADTDYTIVNPAHLTLERRLDVCGQCHLQSAVSMLREGQEAFGFRPGNVLADYQALFAPDVPENEGQIRVISHGERMQKSACFLASQARGGMDCVTCHDPHEGFRDKGPAYFNDTCLTCHSTVALADRFAGTPQAATHQPTSNCFSCHMPKVESVEAPHASFTDHWIRVVREVPAPPPDSVERVTLVPYYAQDRSGDDAAIYEGMAYVVYGQQRADRAALERGAARLDEALAGREGYGEARYLLGFARYQLGQVRAALPALEAARALGPGIPERLNTLALAYEATGAASAQVLALYEEALRIQPALAEIRVNYGRYLEKLGRLDAAAAQYAQAAREQPALETAHYNLGTAYLRQGELARAEETLNEAVHLDPDNAQARGNLGLLYASQGRDAEAQTQFVAAVEAAPQSAVALANLGTYYLNAAQPQKAQPLLERAIVLDPGYVDALVNLALLHVQANRPEDAARLALQVLQLRPDEPRARQILGATRR